MLYGMPGVAPGIWFFRGGVFCCFPMNWGPPPQKKWKGHCAMNIVFFLRVFPFLPGTPLPLVPAPQKLKINKNCLSAVLAVLIGGALIAMFPWQTPIGPSQQSTTNLAPTNWHWQPPHTPFPRQSPDPHQPAPTVRVTGG